MVQKSLLFLATFSDIFTNDNLVNKAFNTQLSIGCFPTLCVFLSSPLIDIQQQYFLDCGSIKSSYRWTTNLTKQLWNITHQLWKHRNDILHKSEQLSIISVKELLKSTIITEHELGLDDLPSLFSKYFHIPIRILLLKN